MVNLQQRKNNMAIKIKENITDDNGPDPKLNFRAAEKRPNAAEQFRTENQGPSDTLYCDCIDCIERVKEQNRRIPRLDNELGKKHSLIKVTTIKAKDLNEKFYWGCEACAKLATYNYLKKKILRPRCNDYEDKKKTSRPIKIQSSCHRRSIEKLQGINKSKTKKEQNSYNKLLKSQTQKSCQCIILKESKSTSVLTFEAAIDDESKPPIITDNAVSPKTPYSDDDQQLQKKHPSISSYNTYGSIDQEPMEL